LWCILTLVDIFLFQKSKNRKLEEDISYLRQLEGKVNDITDRNCDLEKSINSLNVLLQTCLEEVNAYYLQSENTLVHKTVQLLIYCKSFL
jgi:hypothetical protein